MIYKNFFFNMIIDLDNFKSSFNKHMVDIDNLNILN